MKKIIRLTESDLIKLVKRVIKEQDNSVDGGYDTSRDKANNTFYKVGTVLKMKRSIDGQIYTVKIKQANPNYILASFNGPGTYEGHPLKDYQGLEVTGNSLGQLEGNMRLGAFMPVK
jgi:hypothetical protein